MSSPPSESGSVDTTTTTTAVGRREQNTTQSRRSFFSSTATLVTTTAVTALASNPQTAQARLLFWQPEEADAATTYEGFKTLLQSGNVKQVEFGVRGNSLSFLDSFDNSHTLVDIPDERDLLKELYQKGVVVSLQEQKYQKKMNAVSFLRDLVGVGDEITEEEMYEYRGYKTYRQSIPERSYAPSGLISGLAVPSQR